MTNPKKKTILLGVYIRLPSKIWHNQTCWLECKVKSFVINRFREKNSILLSRKILMPSTRRQTAKARRPREMDMMSHFFQNEDVLLWYENANPIENELANTINGSVSNNDLETDCLIKGNPYYKNEIRDFSHEGEFPWQDRTLESMQTF